MMAMGVQPPSVERLNYLARQRRPRSGSLTGALDMTGTEEQQMLASLSAISQDIKALLTLVKELTTQQDAADEKAYSQLVNIAHKR
jgi:hypothetical protein